MSVTEVSRVMVNGNCAVRVTLQASTQSMPTVNLINVRDMQTGEVVDIDAAVAALIVAYAT
jgi:hypothetical protein